jgi:hypothetical protein
MVSRTVSSKGSSVFAGLLGALYGAYLGRALSRFEELLETSLPRLGVMAPGEERSNTH